ncbi:MAG: hypothetical protein JSR63_06040 [Proteobacteria bacterium]|nr:hypothetical protein [Pseudomonadota bacterium]
MTNNTTASNNIGERQNSAPMIKLLRARRRVYGHVKGLQRVYFLIALVLPIISLVVAFNFDKAKPSLSLLALIIGALDAMFFDPWRKQKIKMAARLQEEFDCHVLEMAWNKFTAGARVSPEDVDAYGRELLKRDAEGQLKDWYPSDARRLPLHLARLVCQRTNLWYDSKLRRTYRTCLWAITALYFLALLMFGLDLPLSDFILAVLVPFGPFFTWVVREHHRQTDTIALVDRLTGEIEGSIDRLSNPESQEDAQARARELQDAIFAHRAGSPLVSDLVYKFKRRTLEEQMQAGASEFIARVTSASRAVR